MASSKKKPHLISRIFYSSFGLFVTSWLLRTVISALYHTLRLKIEGKEALKLAKEKKALIALWHDQLILAPLIRQLVENRPLGIVVSKSRDGQMLGAFAKTFTNVFCIFVGHKSRASALKQMVDALQEQALLLITPDGPRGPRHEVKQGVLFCAEKAEAQIIAMRWQASNVWKLNTWDQLQIPKPFSSVTITFVATETTSLQKDLFS